MNRIFETVSFHIVKPCNYSCKFCYATYQTLDNVRQLTLGESAIILSKLADAGVKKVTFAGGEPTLHKDLPEMIKIAKALGLTTGIITNGSLVTLDFFGYVKDYLDWFGISIDSFMIGTNLKIGRYHKRDKYGNKAFGIPEYMHIIAQARAIGCKIKVNTVVNKYNNNEYMGLYINRINADRWKIFDTLRVSGQNDHQYRSIKSTDFQAFVDRHSHPNMVVENNDMMTGSYLLINPRGEFYENWGEHTRRSSSLLEYPVEYCLDQINLDRSKFIERGGIYDW